MTKSEKPRPSPPNTTNSTASPATTTTTTDNSKATFDFSDELKRRLAVRQTSNTSSNDSKTTIQEDKSDSQNNIRSLIRAECDTLRKELLVEARLMIRAELRSMSYDSHI